MPRRWRVLSVLFALWAAFQLAGAFALGAWAVWNGRARGFGVALSVAAMWGFPIGTALGIFGLWALWTGPHRPAP